MARRSTSWQVNGEAMHSLLYPVQNEREALRRQGLKPKDHAKENARHIRELQQLQQHNAQTELKRQQTETELFKMQKFKDAKSQVREWIEREGYLHPQGIGSTGDGAMQRPATAGGYIRKGEGQRRGPASRDSILEVRGLTDIEKREKLKIKPAVPTRLDCRATDQARPSQDYLTLNALAAIRPSSAQPKSAAARVLNPVNTIDRHSTHTNTVAIKHEEYGKVPHYLLKRKEEMVTRQQKVHERLKHHPTDCPPGMRLMKDEDRLETLRQLEDSRLKLLKSLADLPLIVDTLTLQRQKTGLESRLSDVEKAVKLYSRSRVFVRD